MINGLDIYYSKKNIGPGLKPIGTNKQTISQKAKGLKPISINKGGSCKKIGRGLKILQWI